MAESKLHEVLRRASLFLDDNRREPKVAELLLEHYLDVDRTAFFAMMRDPVPEDVLQRFWSAVEAHAQTGVPLEHLTGYAPFYGRDFRVTGDTLIPRPETEELTQLAVQTASPEPFTIADIGTGSGSIAVTLALELPQAAVYATDLSTKALEVARYNAAQMEADVTFFEGDYGKPLLEQGLQVDMLVSNPPYIALDEKSTLSDTVKNFDPEEALFAGDDGLAGYRTIVNQLPRLVKPHGYCLLEVGSQQAQTVQCLLQGAFPESHVAIVQDISQKDRMVKAGPLIDS
ncbi:peptide chain release factor N(5)-glutamine methyltransferase [Barrientosiimonas marina]|uniref:Release factor glutamine methyltransferase n=1 Tax=Lentibacillus kimchii TaxID=1542911 RepID=A0ABW2UVD4_9BACI